MMMRGKVRWFSAERGYGFAYVEKVGEAIIHPEDFVDERGIPNWDEVKDRVVPDAIVEFMGVYKIRAVNIKLLSLEEVEKLASKKS